LQLPALLQCPADRIGSLMKEGKLTNIVAVPTSVRTFEQARDLGIPLATLDEVCSPHASIHAHPCTQTSFALLPLPCCAATPHRRGH
jgi:hypothetical protein